MGKSKHYNPHHYSPLSITHHCPAITHDMCSLSLPYQQLTESENRVDELTEEVSNVISKTCNCDFSQSYISMPTLQCAPVNPDISNILLYQARVQEGGGSPLNYRHLVTVLEATANTSFRYKVSQTSEKSY